MHPSGASEPTVVYKDPLFADEHWFLINVFIRETPTEENNASECTRTVAERMVGKFYSCTNTKRMSTDTT